MKIAIDCRTILNPEYGESAGVGHYVYYLVRELLREDRRDKFVLFFDRRLSEEAARYMIGGARNAKAVFFPWSRYRKYMPIAYSHLLAAATIAKEAPDILHVPAGATPLATKLPTVITVHDLAIYSHPGWFPRQDLSVKVTYPRAVASARRIIAVSEATKRDIVSRFRIPAARISAIHPGVDVSGESPYAEDIFSDDDVVDFGDLVRRYGLERPYFLFLGTLEPRKNVKALCEAFVRAWKASPVVRETELLVAGKPGWADGGAVAAAKAAKRATKGAVRLLGYVGHRDKFPLMRSARAFVFPSLAEGFGLPVVEALALGVPTLVSDVPVFREVAGPAALYADPRSVPALAKAISRIAGDGTLQRKLAAAGPKRARRYSWKATAKETLEVYRKAAKGR